MLVLSSSHHQINFLSVLLADKETIWTISKFCLQTLHHTEEKFPNTAVTCIKMHMHSQSLEKPLTHCCAPMCSTLVRGTTQSTGHCRYPNMQFYASLWQAFFGIITSSFILALSSCCLDCNASETMNSCLRVAPLNATGSLIQTPEVHFLGGRGEIHKTGSITPFLKESFLRKSVYLPLQCLLYWRRYSIYRR